MFLDDIPYISIHGNDNNNGDIKKTMGRKGEIDISVSAIASEYGEG